MCSQLCFSRLSLLSLSCKLRKPSQIKPRSATLSKTANDLCIQIALSFLSSIALMLGSLFGSSTPPTWALVLPLVNVVAVAAAFMHNQNYWKAKAKVPFVGGFNEGIEKSKEVRQLLVFLGILWGSWGFQSIIT